MTWVHYAREVDPADVNNAHTLAGLMVPGGSRVLDVGTGIGAVAEFLAGRGCRIWGVEADAEAAARAARWCVRVAHADVETLDLDREFGGERFGTILCLDVLEHLKDPAATLRRVVGLLESGGQVIVSLPNVTHASVRLQMLHGRFPRTDAGLLDRTHLQFFDRAAALALMADAGLQVVQELRVVKRPDETELPYELGGLNPEIVEAASDGPDATTYQFVFAAVAEEAARTADAPALATVLQQRLNDVLARQAVTTQWARSIEQQHVRLQGELADLKRALEVVTRERDEIRRGETALRAEVGRETAARVDAERRLAEVAGHAAAAAAECTRLRDEAAAAQQARAAIDVELEYERRVAREQVRRQEGQDRRSLDLTVALVARGQQIEDLQRQLAQAGARHARLQREVSFLQNDRVVRDAFVTELRQRLLDAERHREGVAEARDEAEARSAARIAELETRLTQPRYVVVDRLNAALKKWGLAHRLVKAWATGSRPASRP